MRGFIAGAMKKAGYKVESFKPEGGECTYRIVAGGLFWCVALLLRTRKPAPRKSITLRDRLPRLCALP